MDTNVSAVAASYAVDSQTAANSKHRYFDLLGYPTVQETAFKDIMFDRHSKVPDSRNEVAMDRDYAERRLRDIEQQRVEQRRDNNKNERDNADNPGDRSPGAGGDISAGDRTDSSGSAGRGQPGAGRDKDNANSDSRYSDQNSNQNSEAEAGAARSTTSSAQAQPGEGRRSDSADRMGKQMAASVVDGQAVVTEGGTAAGEIAIRASAGVNSDTELQHIANTLENPVLADTKLGLQPPLSRTGEPLEIGMVLPQAGESLPPGSAIAGSTKASAVRDGKDGGGSMPSVQLSAKVGVDGKNLSLIQATTVAGVEGENVNNTASNIAQNLSLLTTSTLQGRLNMGSAVNRGALPAVADAGDDKSNTTATKNIVESALSRLISQPAVQRYQSTGDRAAVMQTGVQIPVGDAKWQGAIHERVMWLASQQVSSAEIHLDPPELGPLQIKISLTQDQAQVTFTSQHASVREALDQGAYRLRELFESQGLDLVNVDVADQSFQGQSQSQGDENGGAGGVVGESLHAGEEAPLELSGTLGLVDHYV